MENTDRTDPAVDHQQAPTGVTGETGSESLDTSSEVATVLVSKRWEQRDRPFQGFDSPPGRF
ncbi:MAG: hypothetical protein V3S20_03350 [Dehalococcoidia bacterium]